MTRIVQLLKVQIEISTNAFFEKEMERKRRKGGKNIFFLGYYENFHPKGIRLPDFQEFPLDLKNFPGLSSTF